MVVRIVVSFLYLLALMVFAWRARRKTTDIEDYYVGGRNVATSLIAFSFFATFVSTNSFIGHSAKSYVYGASWYVVGIVLVVLTALSWLVIAPRFRRVAGRLGSVVPSDFYRLHFHSPAAGGVAAIIIVFDSIVFLGAVFLGASQSAAALLNIPFVWALVIVFGVQIIYTTVGGYLADVWSDALQAGVLLIGAIAIPVALVVSVGGWDSMSERLQALDSVRVAAGDFSLLHLSAAAPLLVLLGIGLSGGLKMVADPRQLSRFYGLRNDAAVKHGVWLVTALVAVTYFFLLPIGLLARGYGVPPEVAERTDAIVPWLLADASLVGPVFGAVLLTALMAAAMSTVDSVLLVAAASFQRDLLPLFSARAGVASLAVARRVVIACAGAALLVALVAWRNPAAGVGIVELTVLAGAMYAGAFLPSLLGILYWKKSSAVGAISGMIAGVIATTVWYFAGAFFAGSLARMPEVFVGLMVGTAVFVIVSLARPDRATSP